MRHYILEIMKSPNEHALTTEPELLALLNQYKTFVLSTHKNSDGDGIGSAIALYWGLKQKNKQTYFFHVDAIPRRYSFLIKNTDSRLTDQQIPSIEADILIITDTNQGSLCDPIYSHFKKQGKPVVFIDHHLPSSMQSKNEMYFIRTQASSTGEVAYDILKSLQVEITTPIATALYTGITFDTQAFKLLRNSSRSHEIAALLSQSNIETDKIQRELFATWTIEKMSFLANLIQNTKYSKQNTVAGFVITLDQLKKYALELDHINDLLDMFTLIKSIDFCYSIIEIASGRYKLSFRSITTDKAFQLAELFGGGGHAKSAGAWVQDLTVEQIENRILNLA